jgi:BirA family biotin operon repressor/biotin-[acetyl-CoA-carboxylase] ligase
MYHQHFNTIGSTQVYLKENLEKLKVNEQDILISCSEQTEAVGRRGNTWDTYPNSLAISFTLKPNPIPSMTPLEIGLITINYFQKKIQKKLYLKWPNDILTSEGKKCGGILCQYIDSETVIVGLGINLGKVDSDINPSYKHGLGIIDQDLRLNQFDQKQIAQDLYQEHLSKRILDKDELKINFSKNCYHLNKNVFIYENEKDFVGIFRGIGDQGEALVEIDSTIQKFLTSSLTILD